MGMDPSIWIAVGALLVSIIFGILNTSHNSNSDIQAQLDDARRQAEVISGLSLLCSGLISELAMYRETDREERRMEDIMKGGQHCIRR